MDKTQSQMLKGILEGCILSIIEKEEVYGYELSKKLYDAGLNMVKEGSIYPLLLRMEKAGWVDATLKPSPAGPNRKYYKLTKQGEEALHTFRDHWQQLKNAVHKLEGR
ncbi:transcriptional regulator, PadR family [Geomicrobium sp. JCM 19037]|uniref:PadR family transcriptional regulator n=1 Tax=Geomicrobium sp. JCM 19037 TaxID=1460634 RepID=UPI00045F3054|nr:PadR family transcriptional regulator [Geomicrobium sp. JCM 19037]GAK05744.1 transcriptional regulator, PadR family [Geomicrobium sp. JCM 19037]